MIVLNAAGRAQSQEERRPVSSRADQTRTQAQVQGRHPSGTGRPPHAAGAARWVYEIKGGLRCPKADIRERQVGVACGGHRPLSEPINKKPEH